MRKNIFAFALFVFAALTVLGQALRKTERIDQNQVPITIRLAFETEFGKIPEGGYWTASFVVEKSDSRSVAKPLSYTYHKKTKTEKIEIRYTAAGDLDYARGMEVLKSSES